MNGSLDDLWKKVNDIAEFGCPMGDVREKAIDELKRAIKEEERKRELATKELFEKLDKIKDSLTLRLAGLLAAAIIIQKLLS